MVVRTQEGLWRDTSAFRAAAIHFVKHGYYCDAPKGTLDYKEYWDEELRRTREGYEYGGVRITGYHYAYLNYTQIEQTVNVSGKETKQQKKERKAKKVKTFPQWWDGDYDFFWYKEIARNGITPEELDTLKLGIEIDRDSLDGGYHCMIGKRRRAGYSYKDAAIASNNYNTIPNSTTLIGAFEKKYLYPEGTATMVLNNLNFLNEHTAWKKARDVSNTYEARRASYMTNVNGVPIEKGYKSQILTTTFKDNPDAARGKDAYDVILEEVGAFNNLDEGFWATDATCRDGDYMTGQMTMYGTGGDMDAGSIPFSNMFYNPKEFNILPCRNIWDDDAEHTFCGFFHPVWKNLPGHIDEYGNSLKESAIASQKEKREKLLKNSRSLASYQRYVQEWPMCPAESFLSVSVNDLPVELMRRRLEKIKLNSIHNKMGTPVELIRENGVVKAIPDLTGTKLKPIWNYRNKDASELGTDGAVIIFESPHEDPEPGDYKLGYDPYQQDQSTGPSYAAIYVIKGNNRFSQTNGQIVAMYVGRPSTTDDVNEISLLLCEYYGSPIMHENMIKDVKTYYERKNKLKFLAAQPDRVIKSSVANSKVVRGYGCHMNEQLKDTGIKFIKRWLLREIVPQSFEFDKETGEEKPVEEGLIMIDTICDPGILEELIEYRPKRNFDRIMAFMMALFQEEEDSEIEKDGSENYEDLLMDLAKHMFN